MVGATGREWDGGEGRRWSRRRWSWRSWSKGTIAYTGRSAARAGPNLEPRATIHAGWNEGTADIPAPQCAPDKDARDWGKARDRQSTGRAGLRRSGGKAGSQQERWSTTPYHSGQKGARDSGGYHHVADGYRGNRRGGRKGRTQGGGGGGGGRIEETRASTTGAAGDRGAVEAPDTLEATKRVLGPAGIEWAASDLRSPSLGAAKGGWGGWGDSRRGDTRMPSNDMGRNAIRAMLRADERVSLFNTRNVGTVTSSFTMRR